MQAKLSTIAARFIKPYLALGRSHFDGLGLEGVDFDDPEARVDYTIALRVFDLGEQLTGRHDLGIAGALRNGSTLRILEYLSRVSRTPLDALDKVARYQNLVHDACLFTLERSGDGVTAVVGSRDDVPFPPVVADFFMASLVLGLYRLGVPAAGAVVQLVRPAPPDATPFEALFRCPIRFGAEQNRATFPIAGLSHPQRDADPALCRALELHAEGMLARLPKGEPLLDELRRWIVRCLADGELSVSAAAEHLGLSERTLRRRLREQGTSFQALVDVVRAGIARDYLEQTDLAVEEIAFLLGFSEASAFRRAYARWHGRPISPRRTLAARSA
jgi:AraC-like DNA-binding protein